MQNKLIKTKKLLSGLVIFSLALSILPFSLSQSGLTFSVSVAENQSPSSCVILDNEFCNSGKPVRLYDWKLNGLGFKLPRGTKIYSPFQGVINTVTAPSFNIDGTLYPSIELFKCRDHNWADRDLIYIIAGEKELELLKGTIPLSGGGTKVLGSKISLF